MINMDIFEHTDCYMGYNLKFSFHTVGGKVVASGLKITKDFRPVRYVDLPGGAKDHVERIRKQMTIEILAVHGEKK